MFLQKSPKDYYGYCYMYLVKFVYIFITLQEYPLSSSGPSLSLSRNARREGPSLTALRDREREGPELD